MSSEIFELRKTYLKELNNLLLSLTDAKQIKECKAEIALVESYIAKQFKKKHRWVFQGWDTKGQEVFPKSFVIIDNRPPSPTMSIDEFGNIVKTYYQTDIQISQNFMNEARVEYNVIREKIENLNIGKLSLLDGCGMVIESHNLQNMKVISIQTDPEDFEFNQEYNEVIWVAQYDKWDWEQEK
jgi:hypothetical protein